MFGGATCHANQTTNGYCNDSWAIDDDANNDGVGDPTPRGNEAVVQYVRGAGTDTAGTVEGFPTAAFDWNTFAYYSTYVAFHDVSGTVDRVYVRTQTGAAEYSWDTPSGEQIVGTPRWNTGVNDALPVRGDGVREGLPADRQRGVAGAGRQRQLGGGGEPVRLRVHDRDAAGHQHDEPVLGRHQDVAGGAADLDDESDDAGPADGVAVH